MLAVDVKGMELPDLIKLRDELLSEISVKQQVARASFIDEMRTRAESLGFALGDFVELKRGSTRRARSSGGTRAIAPKYRNPTDLAQTWAGRGKKPAWVVAHETAGGSLDDLLIAKEGLNGDS